MDPQALLEKMGWKQGQGLGRRNQGISTAIKPKVQLDRNGLGLNPAACLVEPWWAQVFNQTAQNVSVTESIDNSRNQSVAPNTARVPSVKKSKKDKKQNSSSRKPDQEGDSGGGHVENMKGFTGDECPVEPRMNEEEGKSRTKRRRTAGDPEIICSSIDDNKKAHNNKDRPLVGSSVATDLIAIKRSMYKNFVKGTTLEASDCLEGKRSPQLVADAQKASESDSTKVRKRTSQETIVNPIDNFMLESCEGRTGHKGARYGVLKGKMARVMRQESLYSVSTSEAVTCKVRT